MSTWIIDGNNLLHRDPRLRAILQQSGFDAARRFLESELGRRRGAGHQFHVVYDGGGGSSSGQVKIGVARPGTSADDEILRLARAHGGQQDLKVVTSDRHDIGLRLADLSVQWVSVEAFRKVLWDAGQIPGGGALRAAAQAEEVNEKPRAPRGADVDHWLKEFGEEPSDAPD